MRVVFAGTPEFSLSSLEALVAHPGVELVAVYTQPDRPSGRGKKLTSSPIKTRALELDIPVYQPENFRQQDSIEQLQSLQADLMVVTAYGLILPQEVLQAPALGCVNVHASLLPRWRGAAPIQRAIEAGDKQTGVTLMQMEAGLDTGPMLAKSVIDIDPAETGGSLHDKLSMIGGRLLSDALDAIADSALKPEIQDESQASYAAKLVKSEARVDWQEPAEVLARKVRAFNPWPMANTKYADQVIRILSATVLAQSSSDTPGTVIEISSEGICIAAGEGCLLITKLQKAGSKPMAAKDFLNGSKIKVGDCVGEA